MSVFTSLIKDHPCDLPPTVDAEYRNSIPDKGRVMAWINTCRILMTKATGKEAMIYTSPDFWKTEGSLDVGWTRSPLWQANYFTSMTKMLPEAVTPDMWPVPIPPWKRISFWQYTSHGDGLKYGIESKDADIDLFNGTYDDLLKFCGLDNEPVPPTPPPPAHPLPLEDRLGNLEREAVIHGWNIPVPV
jgi:GH25 family lysozyme M1 (1,4-beta-N-acetylmuramidase)